MDFMIPQDSRPPARNARIPLGNFQYRFSSLYSIYDQNLLGTSGITRAHLLTKPLTIDAPHSFAGDDPDRGHSQAVVHRANDDQTSPGTADERRR
jgi:hypothetical protein